jgi:hypothetical protein
MPALTGSMAKGGPEIAAQSLDHLERSIALQFKASQ